MGSNTAARPGGRLTQALDEPGRTARLIAESAKGKVKAEALIRAARRSRPATEVLSHREALRRNGFTVFRSLVPPDECAELAARFKTDAGVTDGVEFTRTDATNKLPSTRVVLFDERVLGAVRSVLDPPARFLQTSDLHYMHDTAGWHRDSVHRAADNAEAPDWKRDAPPFQIVKAILYLESDNAAMGVMAGSHLSPVEIDIRAVKAMEKRRAHHVIDAQDDPQGALTPEQQRLPVAWRSLPGDLLVFDQRMYHCGRRVDNGSVSEQTNSAKLTLSLVFGTDNMHSERFWSYFRYARRELGYLPFDADFRRRLEEHDLLLSTGTVNYYEKHPEELRMAHLRNPEQMDELVAQFARAGADGTS